MDGMGGGRLGEAELRKGAGGGGRTNAVLAGYGKSVNGWDGGGEARGGRAPEGGGGGRNRRQLFGSRTPHHTLCIRYTPHAVHMPHATRHARVAPPAPSCTCKGWCGVE